ncbi:MAG: ABC-F family ATP-binding cassette domain-containing protein [Myxococcaceae bacterium]|nr:ABC-F family ATP-binding cassette domain-containing protein [Myxococcaceae bacterium]
MSLVIAKGVSLSYGKKTLYQDAAFSIGPGDKIGLVGPNGTGKSTLLKILSGQLTPDRGSLVFRRGIKVGYLPQDLVSAPQGTVIEQVMRSVPGRDGLESKLLELEAALAGAKDEAEQLELAQALADTHETKDHFDEHYGRHRAEAILKGLGFQPTDSERELAQLSGGWRMRAALAGLLLQAPDLLLLDEPTNHLDLPTLAWFDAFLKRSRQSLVLISHDREFLNRQIDRVLSLELEGLRSYTGNHDDYRRLRAQEYELLLARAEKVEAKRAEMQAFVDRFRAKASKAKQAQSRMKQLEKLETVQVHQERSTVSFSFAEVPQGAREVLVVDKVSKAYGAHTVYRNASATLWRGQRVAVVGVNGAGKTTLLKIAAGELTADSGTVTIGNQVQVGYYAQHHGESLDPTLSVLETLQRAAPARMPQELRGVLGAFLFTGDDVDKKVKVLSGGERARVALARLLLTPANLLLLDEPTNHLDLDSAEALIEALEGYGGTILFVTHNRSFLDTLATHVWDVRDHGVVPYPGNLAEYLHHLELEAAEAPASGAAPESRAKVSEKDRKRLEAEARQARSAKTGPLKKEIAALEAKIATLETEQKAREAQLVDPAFAQDFAKARPVMEAHREAAEVLEESLARWEAAQAELQEAERT